MVTSNICSSAKETVALNVGCLFDRSQGQSCCSTAINVERLYNINMKRATKLQYFCFDKAGKVQVVPRQSWQSYFKLQDSYDLRINKALYIPQTLDEIIKVVTSLISDITARRKN